MPGKYGRAKQPKSQRITSLRIIDEFEQTLAEYQEDQRIKQELGSFTGWQHKRLRPGSAIQTFDDLLLAPPPPEDGVLLGGYSLDPVEAADLDMVRYKPKSFYRYQSAGQRENSELFANKSELFSSLPSASEGSLHAGSVKYSICHNWRGAVRSAVHGVYVWSSRKPALWIPGQRADRQRSKGYCKELLNAMDDETLQAIAKGSGVLGDIVENIAGTGLSDAVKKIGDQALAVASTRDPSESAGYVDLRTGLPCIPSSDHPYCVSTPTTTTTQTPPSLLELRMYKRKKEEEAEHSRNVELAVRLQEERRRANPYDQPVFVKGEDVESGVDLDSFRKNIHERKERASALRLQRASIAQAHEAQAVLAFARNANQQQRTHIPAEFSVEKFSSSVASIPPGSVRGNFDKAFSSLPSSLLLGSVNAETSRADILGGEVGETEGAARSKASVVTFTASVAAPATGGKRDSAPGTSDDSQRQSTSAQVSKSRLDDRDGMAELGRNGSSTAAGGKRAYRRGLAARMTHASLKQTGGPSEHFDTLTSSASELSQNEQKTETLKALPGSHAANPIPCTSSSPEVVLKDQSKGGSAFAGKTSKQFILEGLSDFQKGIQSAKVTPEQLAKYQRGKQAPRAVTPDEKLRRERERLKKERQEQRIARLMETFTTTSYADELRSAESSTGDPLPSDAVAGPFLRTSSLPVILRERVERMEEQRSDRMEKTEVRIKRKRLEQQKTENQTRLDRLEDDLTRETLERMSAFYEHLANQGADEETDKLTKKRNNGGDSPETKNYLRTHPAGLRIRGSGRVMWLEDDERDPFRIHPRVSLRTA
ncbi:hypothetical protein CSUI_002516 [Cystoisospora suis]|uniref:Uncharacterized protein n=1 Tax=Cystoisospora suis TaxID=483139 RepID=A0A2C6L8R6_9APIC|nr:hypothetical protein CSUI_002516 [Cystoisospora suis]